MFITRTCDACPSQWHIVTEGRHYYARYRYGRLSLHRSTDDGWPLGPELFAEQLGDDLDGCMEDEEMLAHLLHVMHD